MEGGAVRSQFIVEVVYVRRLKGKVREKGDFRSLYGYSSIH